jgi:putative transposase
VRDIARCPPQGFTQTTIALSEPTGIWKSRAQVVELRLGRSLAVEFSPTGQHCQPQYPIARMRRYPRGANRESRSSWRDFLLGLKARGLHGVEFVVADDHAGLRAALREALAEAAYQRCYVHFLRNALDYVPRKVDDDCLQELRWLYDRRDLIEARRDLAAWLAKWSAKYSKLTGWVEDNIDETLTFYRLPRQHHKHLKSTNMLERLNEEIKRRTHVVRIFPNGESCLRLVRALAVETHENWLEQHRYLNMDDLREHKKEALRCAA